MKKVTVLVATALFMSTALPVFAQTETTTGTTTTDDWVPDFPELTGTTSTTTQDPYATSTSAPRAGAI